MNVLMLGNFEGRGWDGSITDENHIADALEELGHTVDRCQREMVEKIMSADVDFTLVAQWDGYPNLDWLPQPIVYWAFDYQADGQDWHERLVAEADLYLSKRIADSKYSNWQWLSQQFSPNFLDKAPSIDKDIDILFTGSYLPWANERNDTLKAIDDKFKLTICSVNGAEFTSRGFKDVRGPVMDEELPQLIARTKLNIAIDHTLEAGYWSDRAAQIMACGGFVLHRYVPLMEAVFRQKLGYFYGIEDCLTKIEAFLEMPLEDVETIAQIGYEYAHEELMVTNTVADLLTIIEGII